MTRGSVAMAMVLALALGRPSLAAAASLRPLPEADRVVPGGRAVEVLVRQAGIRGSVAPSPAVAPVALGGGVAGGAAGGAAAYLIQAAILSAKAHKLDAKLAPLRAALADYDLKGAAASAAQVGVDKVDWFAARSLVISSDGSQAARERFLDSSGAAQVAFFDVAYDLTPDLSALRVSVDLTLANRAVPFNGSKDQRLWPDSLPMIERIVCIEALPDGGTVDDNLARWSEHDGALARRALDAAFSDLKALIPRTLRLTPADVKAMRAGKGRIEHVGDIEGRVQDEGPTGELLFSDVWGLVSVRPLPLR